MIPVSMRAKVFVSPKKTVLDPQGQAIHSALTGMGFKIVDHVRQGKFFELNLAPGTTRQQAQADVDRLARDILTNPVIEEYSFIIED